MDFKGYNFVPHIVSTYQRMTGERGSYSDYVVKEIYIYYHKSLPKDLAMKILIFDVDHECFHAIVEMIEDNNASKALDSKFVTDVTMWLNSKLYNEHKNNSKFEIRYTKGLERIDYE